MTGKFDVIDPSLRVMPQDNSSSVEPVEAFSYVCRNLVKHDVYIASIVFAYTGENIRADQIWIEAPTFPEHNINSSEEQAAPVEVELYNVVNSLTRKIKKNVYQEKY